ncbi:25283_t:CDS:2 [Gigaspora margarita]|uniref:25283_t:CDS:1 n=1 Tax=Gigaspora margarita TaxID=4874 RepID=A0ABN7VBS6_GIGMA|nr:25283_t:CDS:2 [Gigaspora margarita]
MILQQWSSQKAHEKIWQSTRDSLNMWKIQQTGPYHPKLTLHDLLGNTAEELLLCQVRNLKAKAVYIPQSELRKLFAILEILRVSRIKNNSTQQEGAETSSRYKSEIKEKKITRFIKKDKNRTGRKTLELGNYTTMKSKWKHTGKENNNTTKNLNTRRMTHKNNLSNENEERSGHSKNESLNATLQEILNRLEKIESSYSSSRAIATPDTGRAPTAPKVAKSIPKKEGLRSTNLKGKKKEHLMDNIGNMMKNRFMRINKAEKSRKMKTLEDYQVLKLDQDLADAHAMLKDNRNLVTWKREEQESEIDYIWISKDTKDMDLVMNSNHKLLITALDIGINTRFRSHTETRKKSKRRLVFELEKAMEDD